MLDFLGLMVSIVPLAYVALRAVRLHARGGFPPEAPAVPARRVRVLEGRAGGARRP